MQKCLSITTMSSRGQIVVPEEVRRELGLESGSKFVVFGKGDTIVMKQLNLPSPTEALEELHKWGRTHAKKMGIEFKEEDSYKFTKHGKRDK